MEIQGQLSAEINRLSSLRAYAFRAIGELRVTDVTAPMVRDLLLPIWIEKPETARRVRQRVCAVLDWAHSRGFRTTEAPLRAITKGLPRQPKRDRHFAAMPYEEVTSLMALLVGEVTVGRLALRFTILTAARSGEVRGARWPEIDIKARLWTVPGDRMKAGTPHVVPLVDEALAVLKVASTMRSDDDGFVFPGLKKGKPLSNMTLSKVLKANSIGIYTVHGFRSSFRDWAAEQTSVAGEIVESALAHTIANKVEAAYRRTNFLQKRRELMEAWSRYVTGRTGEVVVLERVMEKL